MYTLRCVLVYTSHEILVDIFCHERNHRRGCLADSDKRCIKRHISIDLILFHAFCPETFTASSHIPVAHVVHKILERSCCLRYAVIVHDRQFVVFQRIFCRIEFVDIRIQYKEGIRIPERAHKLTLSLCHCLAVETVWKPWGTVHIEVPADRIRAVFFKCVKRIYCISLGLAHLLAVLVLHVAEYDDILIRSFIKYERRDSQQRIEPSSRLVNSLRNKVRRKLLFKKLFIFKRIVVLCKRHGAGIKPAVDNFRHTVHLFAALWTFYRNFIYIRTVELNIVRAVVRHGLQLLNTADRMLVSAFTFPYIQRCSPVTVAAYAPVLHIFQPVTETALADALRNPVDRVVICDQVILHRCHIDEP